MTIRRKKLIVCLASVLLAVALFAMFAGTAWAVGDAPVSSTQGSGFGNVLGGVGGFLAGLGGTAALEIWNGLLLIIQTLASAVLFIAGFFLDNIFYYNVVLNPNNMPVVQEGWAIMRDIANSIFILIILWIAFTLIFNVEKQGTQKLLVRIILIALLINFSLTLVSVVFGVANALALPFRDAIAGENKNDVASIIIGRVRLQTIFETPSTATVEKYKTDKQFAENNCGFGSLTSKAGAGCLLGAETVDFATSFTKGFAVGGDLLFGSLSRAVSSSISILFLLLAILSFIVASITLLIRLVAMVFLSVLAPAAFIAAAIPTAKAQQLWNKWLSELFCWAFYAPAFYFLFWLSLRMLEVMTDGLPQASPGNFGSFILAMLPFIVFFAFLWASVKIGKYLGCEGAGMAIDWGKKLGNLGLTAATGGAGRLAAMGLTRALGPAGLRVPFTGGRSVKLGAGLTRMAATPGLRWLGGAYPQRLATQYMGDQQKRIDTEQKNVAAFSRDQLIADYGASFLPERKVAIMRRAAQEGWMKQFEEKYHDTGVKSGLDLATRYGAQGPILDEMPHLATKENVPNVSSSPEAINVVVKRVKERVKIRKEVYRDSTTGAITPAGTDVLRGIMLNTNINELGDIGRKNADLQGALKEFLKVDANLDSIRPDPTDPNSTLPANRLRMTAARHKQIGEYFAGTLAKGKSTKGGLAVGWEAITNW